MHAIMYIFEECTNSRETYPGFAAKIRAWSSNPADQFQQKRTCLNAQQEQTVPWSQYLQMLVQTIHPYYSSSRFWAPLLQVFVCSDFFFQRRKFKLRRWTRHLKTSPVLAHSISKLSQCCSRWLKNRNQNTNRRRHKEELKDVTAPEISILNHSEASRNYLSFFQNYLSLINHRKINIIATREKTTIPGAVSFFFNPFDSLYLSKREVQPNNMEEFRKKRSNSFLSRGRRIDANVPDVLGNYCLLIEWEFKQLGQGRHGCCKKHRTRIDPDNPNSVQCKEI